ncbi:Serine/threonine-protein kinase OXI1 [Hibiscus syriacus]|uniref:non-specific serine/threonine protein kinase n=1 Tax=Hibiscus syriacus TaxID=106335 RepID=A0A6A2Z0D5_HIBSY|nr:serine/threonine-protein kinase OXI1-like [Hibiscus syriacus]KAE8685298.1 Serine/threonine-protein kinase OXI1 [Hibiscus syriacus]
MIDDQKQLDRTQQHSIPTFDLDRLEIVTALGRGAKGVVFLVRDKVKGDILALKVISRDSIEKKNAKDVKNTNENEYRRVSFEQEVLGTFNHPLLPTLRGVLATDKVVGYAIDYCPGRDLHSLRKKQTEKMFSDDMIRFYAAELVLALEYLHNLGVVYRDLKPENILIQENGHIMLVDFDLSTKLSPRSPEKSIPPNSVNKSPSDSVKKKQLFPFVRCCNSGIAPDDAASQASVRKDRTESSYVEKSNSFVGTEEYVAPEIVSGEGHDFTVDWWSLGIVLHEMLYGTTPFRGLTRKETFYRILTKPSELVGEPTPLRHLIKKLLEKDPKQRITLEGIKGHDYFKGIDWDLILRIQRPPYIPAHSEEEITVEEKDGIKRSDVELFVKEILANGDGGKHDVNPNTDDSQKLNKNNGQFHRPADHHFSVF